MNFLGTESTYEMYASRKVSKNDLFTVTSRKLAKNNCSATASCRNNCPMDTKQHSKKKRSKKLVTPGSEPEFLEIVKEPHVNVSQVINVFPFSVS